MTNEQLDKVMKPYWESKFGCVKLKYFYIYENRWFGFDIEDLNFTICGSPEEDIPDGKWFYNTSHFDGGCDLFNLEKSSFLFAMKRYLNETYNLNITTII